MDATGSNKPEAADARNTRAPRRRTPLQRLCDAVLGTHPQLRSRVKFGVLAIVNYLCWIGVQLYSAHIGWISHTAAAVLVLHHAFGIVAFYPWVRSGRTAHCQDSGLVQLQIMYGASASILGYALNPKLGTALLQVLCFIHLFGLFTLRPRQLLVTGGSTILMLLVMLGLLHRVRPAGLNFAVEANRIGFSCAIIGLITWMSVLHSQQRGRLSQRKKDLARAVQQYNDLVTRDALTGIHNRKHMQDLLASEHARHLHTGVEFCVALIDLDHFKRINDTHGHAVGDEVLRSFTQAALATLRETDTVARWGGEEFLVLLRNTVPAPHALQVVERLRERVGCLIASASVPSLRISFSAGIAACDPRADVDEIIERADRALYAAKQAGRNRCVLAPDPAGEAPPSSPGSPGSWALPGRDRSARSG